MLLEEIWDPHRIIAVLQDMEGRFEQAVAKAEHLLSQSKDTEAELRTQLDSTRAEIPVLEATLNETRVNAKDARKQLVEGSRLKERGLTSEIEKRRFSEWQLRAQLQDMQKRCNQALGLQRVEMVEHAKHKMTEMVLDQLMEDTTRNPTLVGELSTRKRASAHRSKSASADGAASALHSAVPMLRGAGAGTGTPHDELRPASGMQMPRPSTSQESSSTYANVTAMDPSTRPSTSGEVELHRGSRRGSRSDGVNSLNGSDANVDDIIAEIHRMKQLQDSQAYQAEYSRPLSQTEIDFPFNRNENLMNRPDSSGSIGSYGDLAPSYIERPASRGSLPPLEAS
jgi:hypothetical protein